MALFISHPYKLSSSPSLPFSPSQWQVNKKTSTISKKNAASTISFVPLKLESSPKPRTVAMHQQKWRVEPIHVYPDANPEFAQAETQKFRSVLLEKLSKDKHIFGNDMDAIVDVCAQIFSDYLHKDYRGPGTLNMEPFREMLSALKAKKLPGAAAAGRAALLWAEYNLDRDWEIWTSQQSS